MRASVERCTGAGARAPHRADEGGACVPADHARDVRGGDVPTCEHEAGSGAGGDEQWP